MAFGRFLEQLSCFWDVFQDIGRVCKYTRLSLLVTLTAGFVLIFVDQGQDLIFIHAETPGSLSVFYLAIVFWALNAWYWARSTLAYGARIDTTESCQDPYFGGRRRRVKWLIRIVPRLIGVGAFVMIAIAQFRAALRLGIDLHEGQLLLALAAGSLVLAYVFYYFTAVRRKLSQALGRKVAAATNRSDGPEWLMIPNAPAYQKARTLREVPAVVRSSFIVLTAILFALFIVVCAAPAAVSVFGPDAVFLFGASLWIAPGTWLLFVARRGDFPVLTVLLVLALGFSLVNDNHNVREIDDDQQPIPQHRINPRMALNTWYAERTDQKVGSSYLIMVAAAGGGSRAAYWTASVLSTIQDLHPTFDSHLFGISGVSGGSLGAAVYRGLLTTLRRGETHCAQASANASYPYRDCARTVLQRDFLAPTLAAMLFPDLVQRFLPVALLPDRAEALERSWEAAWQHAMGRDDVDNLIADNFLELWPNATTDDRQQTSLPALFLNGTSVATGKRIVTSNLNVSQILTDGFDFFDRWPKSIRTSTAANNSARFPVIGPGGTLTTDSPNGPKDRIVDGGYFENFGAATALDILRDLAATPRPQSASSALGNTVGSHKFIVIQISSDPDYRGVLRNDAKSLVDNCPAKKSDQATPGRFATELFAPMQTLLNTRTARGILAAQSLHDWVEGRPENSAHFIEFRLDIPPSQSEPPLGWVLSQVAMQSIDCQLARPSNWRNLETLGQLLGFDPDPLRDYLKTTAGCGCAAQ